MTKDEELNLAFDALEKAIKDFPVNFQRAKAIAAIKEALVQPEQITEKEKISQAMTAEIVAARALAQPEQEPIAWYYKDGLKRGISLKQEGPEWKPIYTTPPKREWVGLTEAEREEIENRPFSQNDWLWFYTQAIEAKLKQKNT